MVKRRKIVKRKISVNKVNKTPNYLSLFLFGLGCVTFLAVGLPLALWASAEEPRQDIVLQDTDLLVMQTRLEKLDEKLGRFIEKVESINRFDDASADCLNQCRKSFVSCLENNPKNINEELSFVCAEEMLGCAQNCSDRSSVNISCQNTCAISLGGCIERVIAPQMIIVEDEKSVLDSCLEGNALCLEAVCDLSEDSIIQADVCYDQCLRLKNICQSGRAGYDETALDLCDRLVKTCERRVCQTINES
jgi:hypothetical protein